MFAEERRAEIAKLVASARRVNGAELARRYDVTMETVRRDLAALAEAGKHRCFHRKEGCSRIRTERSLLKE